MFAPFLQNTGTALLASLWQFAGLYAAYVLLKNTLLRRISAKADYALLMALLTFGTGWFVAGMLKPQTAPLFSPAGIFPAGNFTHTLLQWLALAYLLVTALRTMLLVRHLFPGSRRLPQTDLSLDADFAAYLETFCRHIGIRLPRITLSPVQRAPFVAGLFRAVIVLPACFVQTFSPQELEAVILHEIAHLKRYDRLQNILVVMYSCLLFFNPFARLLLKRLRRQREVACDDWVLQQQVNPQHYASALYKAARFQHRVPAWQLAMSVGTGELYTRIERLFAANKKHHPFKLQLLPFAALLFCIPLLFTARKVRSLPAPGIATAPAVMEERPIPAFANALARNATPVQLQEKPVEPDIIVVALKPRNTKPAAGQPVPELREEPVMVELVKDEIPVLPSSAFVSTGIKRSNDVVMRYNDSITVYGNFIGRENVEQLTLSQLEKSLALVALGLPDAAGKRGDIVLFGAPDIKVDVSSDGLRNLYFNNLVVTQQMQYDAYFQQWKILFSILNGDQKLGERFVTIYQTRRLQSARL